jgi:NAD(P)-dependent dehydrogenase (short-subunit alcohol dehydrogenase family)/pimeloyl-ACP methyl ester carboxylesterase
MTPSQTVRSGEVELAVYTWGAPSRGPTVVLVHGYPDSAAIWRDTAQLLAESHFVVAYDVRGAGRSSRPGAVGAYAIDRLMEDLGAVLDAVSPGKPVHLVCHDWGSIACWEAITTEPLRERVASFVSISGPCLDHVGHWLRARLRPGQAGSVARQLARSWYIGAFQLPGLGAAAWRVFGRLWPNASATQAEDGRAGVKLYRANMLERLLEPRERRTGTPVLLLCPTRDRFVSDALFEDLPRWASRLWRRDVEAGHWLLRTHPHALAAEVAGFVAFAAGGPEPMVLQRARVKAGRRGKAWRGKLVVVTGAGSGIGRETLLAFAQQGADVVAADLDPASAEASAELARALGGQAWPRKVDVGSVAEMEAFAEWVATQFGAPDVVVNNAGIGMAGGVLDTKPADWDRILRVNLGGVIHGSTLFARQMVASGKRGQIVNVSSGLAFFPSRSTPAYATTKAAVHMLSECLRAELAGKGIGVSAVYPGVVDTPIVSRTQFNGAGDPEAKRARAQRLYDLRRLKPQAVADAIVEGVKHNRAEIRVGAEVHAIRLVSRLLPGLTRRLAQVEVAS